MFTVTVCHRLPSPCPTFGLNSMVLPPFCVCVARLSIKLFLPAIFTGHLRGLGIETLIYHCASTSTAQPIRQRTAKAQKAQKAQKLKAPPYIYYIISNLFTTARPLVQHAAFRQGTAKRKCRKAKGPTILIKIRIYNYFRGMNFVNNYNKIR